MPTFSTDVVAAVLHHMNDDHNDDSLTIARAFGDADATDAEMTTLDEHGGTWTYRVGDEQRTVTVPWSKEIAERPEIRREIVFTYRAACEKLGIEFREH
ncbi:hypothetical protein M2152_002623 [Microbacteriaceae bacterium SG_E_30_P1]|uniref:DUF2470 domain-containing protein n=1 Tax=Antiquaquibacter oligotrophicus TaxID=2880260 RepID=A0ABT6KRH3_9MICO|nr:DUF2470 domain-containing protein [Antiquaquibacter oligotrophicus]MDH6182441.1 hypothetical protein [Antiquaquibacter oligotrophicus]UDF14588.1 DUF2470 domain-containing protein [Antiquaquibacter oligotrophicus]